MKKERLEDEFRQRSIAYSGKPLLFKPADALELVNRAAEEGVPVLGVEGSYVKPGGTESPKEHVVSYSDAVHQGHGCWEDAEHFIRQRAELGLVFEIVLGSDPVEAV